MKCDVCGVMVNHMTIDEHKKNHENAVIVNTSEPLVFIEESEENIVETDFEPEVTLEELVDENTVHTEDTIPIVVLVKMRTKYWPAKVTASSSECYDVTLCKRGDALTVKKVDCKVFTPSPDMCKGQSREWKECYRVAVEIIESQIWHCS